VNRQFHYSADFTDLSVNSINAVTFAVGWWRRNYGTLMRRELQSCDKQQGRWRDMESVTWTGSSRLLRQSQTRTVPSTDPEMTRLESSLNCTQLTRPTDRQTLPQITRPTDRQTDRHSHRSHVLQTDRQTLPQITRPTDRQTDRQTLPQTSIQWDRHQITY